MSCRDYQAKSYENGGHCKRCGMRAVDHAPPYGCNGRVIDLDQSTGTCGCCGLYETVHPAFVVHVLTPKKDQKLFL